MELAVVPYKKDAIVPSRKKSHDAIVPSKKKSSHNAVIDIDQLIRNVLTRHYRELVISTSLSQVVPTPLNVQFPSSFFLPIFQPLFSIFQPLFYFSEPKPWYDIDEYDLKKYAKVVYIKNYQSFKNFFNRYNNSLIFYNIKDHRKFLLDVYKLPYPDHLLKLLMLKKYYLRIDDIKYLCEKIYEMHYLKTKPNIDQVFPINMISDVAEIVLKYAYELPRKKPIFSKKFKEHKFILHGKFK